VQTSEKLVVILKVNGLLTYHHVSVAKREKYNWNKVWEGESMAANIKVKEAAEIMGKCQQFVRVGLQRGLLPFGTAVKLSNSSKFNYYISPKLFYEYVGKPNSLDGQVLAANQTELIERTIIETSEQG